MRPPRLLLPVSLIAWATLALAGQSDVLPPEMEGVGVVEHIGTTVDLDFTFIAENGYPGRPRLALPVRDPIQGKGSQAGAGRSLGGEIQSDGRPVAAVLFPLRPAGPRLRPVCDQHHAGRRSAGGPDPGIGPLAALAR